MFIYLKDKKKLLKLSKILSKFFFNINLCLIGNFGSGKTFFSKGFILKSLEINNNIVKSPTYNLIETYKYKNKIIHHFDLYRLKNISHLYEINFYSCFDSFSIVLVEWGDKFLFNFKYDAYIYFFYYSDFFNRVIFINLRFFSLKELF